MSRILEFRAKEGEIYYSPVYMDGTWYRDEHLRRYAENVEENTGEVDNSLDKNEIWEGDEVHVTFASNYVRKGTVIFEKGGFRVCIPGNTNICIQIHRADIVYHDIRVINPKEIEEL